MDANLSAHSMPYTLIIWYSVICVTSSDMCQYWFVLLERKLIKKIDAIMKGKPSHSSHYVQHVQTNCLHEDSK